MTKQELIDYMQEQQQSRQEYRHYSNLAESLATIAHIPAGKHLVAILGEGSEATNIEALTIWIYTKRSQLQTLEGTGIDPLDYLYAELLRILD